ncbi:DNA starvation/stationary phase protection protein [Geomicrobium sp. JSM 1781026]|uniref:Dps family protein n=1 Tax=Geomicrobium sp. JSM 1781026 TaxID=3344580 RepID=UPI0035C17DDD
MVKRQAEIKGTSARAMDKELNEQLANLHVFYIKLHNYHWYIKGKHFFSLHEKFEEMYDKTKTHIDEYAEQMLTVRVQPLATMKDFLAASTIDEATGNEGELDMVNSISLDLQKMSNELYEIMEQLEDKKALSLADAIQEIARDFQKDDWMLRAYLDQE